jgi:tetratricopeptide (TPR) repeat protein
MGVGIPRHLSQVGILVVILGAIATARADDLDARLAALGSAAPGEPRLAAARAIIEAPPPVPALIDRLRRPRTSEDAERRALLHAIGAEVPNEKGSFTYPGRPSPRATEPDWLAELARRPAGTPALADALEVVTLLRALAESRTEAAADAILDYGFTPDGLVYRDECGRQLRRMSPHSLPTLLRASMERKRDAGAFGRYANYQLDRLSMNRPSYALRAAPDDRLEVAMLHAIRDVRHPDAVTAVLDRVDAPSNAVRRAAREAWLAYVTGPPPPPAPKAFRKLPGGKQSDEPLPLYLTYRELADQEVRRVLMGQLGREPDKKASPAQLTQVLFDLYDRKRAEKGDEVVAGTVALAAEGKWDEVGARYDALLMADPLYARRSQLAPGYLELARLLVSRGELDGAVEAYHKAIAVDPEGGRAAEARAELGAAQARRDTTVAAPAHHASVEPAPVAAHPAGEPARTGWLLYAGLGAATAGALLLAIGLIRRRRAPQAA